ncbi:MAG: immunoglobulin domain-containing protein [Opitutaceae bacterium]
MTRHFASGLRFLLLLPLAAAGLRAQEVRVRPAPRVEMPREVDSNSPAFWRDGRLFWFGSHGRPWLNEGPTQFGPWATSEVDLQSANAWPHWLESVWPEADDRLWGWYHTEPVGMFPDSTLTAPKIGAVLSTDGGRTLRDLGIILDAGDPPDRWAMNGYFAGGHGDFSVLPDRERKFFYFFFDNYAGPAAGQGVGVARMAWEDRANPVGKVWKYHEGAWNEAGVGGKMTPILPVTRRWQMRDPDAFWGPAVHWNKELNLYVMLLNRAQGEPGWSQEGVYVSFSPDLSRPELWTAPRKLIDKAEFPGWYFFYPQVMGLGPGETDREAGARARLYVGGVSEWELEFVAPPRAPFNVEATVAGAATVLPGRSVTLIVAARGTAPFTYQWFRDGAEVPGATQAELVLPAVTEGDVGAYWVRVSNALGSTESSRIGVAVVPPPPATITNLAVRAWLPSAEAALTLGVVGTGLEGRQLLVRAIGPGLAAFGVEETAPNPRLEARDGQGLGVGSNDDWSPALATAFAAVGAFPLPEGGADAALLADARSGMNTFQLHGGGAGVILAELYDPAAGRDGRLVNLSARAWADVGERGLMVGFGIGSGLPRRLLLRVLGPQLAAYGVEAFLANPRVEVFSGEGERVAANDDWEPGLAEVMAGAGAPALMPGSRDAALVLSVAPGRRYTVAVGGAEVAGEVLLEVYELP